MHNVPDLLRRRVIGAASVLPLTSLLVACSSTSNESTEVEEVDDIVGTDGVVTDTSNGEWAIGGTDRITVSYPADDIFDTSTTCSISLTDSTTLGPCYFEDSTGEDISEGFTGLPMQLCLKLINQQCEALVNYAIEVWHCDTEGVYSGDTTDSNDAGSFAGDFCTGSDSDAASSTWYRGRLTTDSSGRVNFKTCFPGWYRGRTIHIHFRVTDPDGSEAVISQFCFTDALAKEICTTHQLYSGRGEQDTTLAGGRDTVFGSPYERFTLNTGQNEDGSLLAWQTIQVS